MQSKTEVLLEAAADGEAPNQDQFDWPWFLIKSLMEDRTSGTKKIYESDYEVRPDKD